MAVGRKRKPFFAAHHVAQYDDCPYQAPAISTGAFFYAKFRNRSPGRDARAILTGRR
jgi:hypothetical protein